MMADAYQVLSVGSMGILAVLMVVCLIRCAIGPRISDRIMAVNMISTLTIIMVAVMTVTLKEGYLADVALVYAILSFLAVIVLCKVYTGIYRERRHVEAEQMAEQREAGPVPDMSIENAAEPKDQDAAHNEEDLAPSTDMPDMNIENAAEPKNQDAAHREEEGTSCS